MPRPKLPATLAAEHEKQAVENDFSAATCTNAAAAAMLMQRATFHATMAVLYQLRSNDRA